MDNLGFEKAGTAGQKENELDVIRKKYGSTGKIYEIAITIQPDDDGEKEFAFVFKKPGTASYDRYVKMVNTSNMKALKAFVLDNIVEEQSVKLSETLEEYPAMALSIGEKLLNMLGLSKTAQVKKL